MPPAELLHCSPRPALPVPPYREQDMAAFVLELNAAHQDCQQTLSELGVWLEDAKGRVEK